MSDRKEKKKALNKRKKILLAVLIPVCSLLFLALCAAAFVYFNYTVTLTPAEGADEVPYFAEYTDAGASARFVGRYVHVFERDLDVTADGTVDTSKTGEYTVTYGARYYIWSAHASRTVRVTDTVPPEITLVTVPDSFTLIGHEYEEEGYTALDEYDGDITDRVVRTVGEGTVTYTVSDSSGNETSVVREIVYDDRGAPEITLKGETTVTLKYGEEYKEDGFTATDDGDGDVTDKVVREVVTDTIAKDVIRYTAEDSHGNKTSVERTVLYTDDTVPKIVLNGGTDVTQNAGFAYNEAGYTATDEAEGDLTSRVSVSGNVEIYRAGTYTLKYTVTDSFGNSASAERHVTVTPLKAPDNIVPVPGKTVYLTFDDGPSRYTSKLLDVLAAYNVKATFFVVNVGGYGEMITREANEGHTVAIHSYTHDYGTIYASEDAYFSDLNRMNDVILSRTGRKSTLLRFPGGSSNAVSSFNPGIMTRLSQAVGDMGYRYFDWNVSSGDAGGTTNTEVVFQNVISGISTHGVSVVLQHDSKGYSVDAVEKILAWGTANGYSFLPLDETSPDCHHSIYN